MLRLCVYISAGVKPVTDHVPPPIKLGISGRQILSLQSSSQFILKQAQYHNAPPAANLLCCILHPSYNVRNPFSMRLAHHLIANHCKHTILERASHFPGHDCKGIGGVKEVELANVERKGETATAEKDSCCSNHSPLLTCQPLLS